MMPRHFPPTGGADQKQPARVDFRQTYGMGPISEHGPQAGVSSEEYLNAFVDGDASRGGVLPEPLTSLKVKNTFIDGYGDDDDEVEDSGPMMGRAKTDSIGLGRHRLRPAPQAEVDSHALMQGMLGGPPPLGPPGYLPPPPYYPDAHNDLLTQMARSQQFMPPNVHEAAGSMGAPAAAAAAAAAAAEMYQMRVSEQANAAAAARAGAAAAGGDFGPAAVASRSSADGARQPQYGLVPPAHMAPPMAVSDVPPPPMHHAAAFPPTGGQSHPLGSAGFSGYQGQMMAGAMQQQQAYAQGAAEYADHLQVPEATPEPASEVIIAPLDRRKPEPSVGAYLHGTGQCQPCAWFWKPQGCGNGQACRHCHMCPDGELKSRKKAKIATLRAGAAANNSSRGGTHHGRRGR